MHKYHCLNPIASVGLDLFSDDYQKVEELKDAEAVLVRSAAMHDLELPEGLAAVARAGAGVNNIPLDKCAQLASDSAVDAPRCGVTMQPFAPTVVVFGKSETYFLILPAASASTIASSSTRRSLAKLSTIAVGFIIESHPRQSSFWWNPKAAHES